MHDYRKGKNDYLALIERILNLDSKVDAQIFEIYGIPGSDAEGIWLG